MIFNKMLTYDNIVIYLYIIQIKFQFRKHVQEEDEETT